MMKKALLLLSCSADRNGGFFMNKANFSAISFALSLKKALSPSVFLKITAVSLDLGSKKGDLPAALSVGADEAVMLRFSLPKNAFSGKNIALQAAGLSFLSKKCGKTDIFIAADGIFSRKMADFLEADYIFAEKYSEIAGILMSKTEKTIYAAMPANFSAAGDHLPGIWGIKNGAAKPFYEWTFNDLGIAEEEFSVSFVPEFEKLLEENSSGADCGGRKKNPPATVLPSDAAGKIYEILHENKLSGGTLLLGGGRGLSSAGFALLRENARLIGAQTAATRPAVQAGRMPASCLAGTSGRRLNASIYLAFGVSGALLHISGINAADIIAVNTDPASRIFDYASMGFVCDANETLRILNSMILSVPFSPGL